MQDIYLKCNFELFSDKKKPLLPSLMECQDF